MDRAGAILAFMFVAGPSLALAALAATDPAALVEPATVGVLAAAYAAAVAVYLSRETISGWRLQAALATATLLITVPAGLGDGTGPYAFFYAWVVVYAFYFFRERMAVAQLALVGAAYAVVALVDHPQWWLIGLGTFVLSGVGMSAVKEWVFGLVERLEHLTLTDPLTGLVNRRGFRDTLDAELERARRSSAPLSVLLGDLDHFKQINDVHGHDAGDVALTRAAAVLTDGIRAVDVAARTGGEEFAVLLPGTDAPEALEVADRLRLSLREKFYRGPQLSISFGIASYPGHGGSAQALLGTADSSLYRAKQLGRDRAVVAPLNGEAVLGEGAGARPPTSEHLVRMLALAEASEARNATGATHAHVVARYAEMTARELGLPESRVERVRLAALLHDVGKVYISQRILKKPAKLTAEERSEVQQHVELSARLLEHEELADVREFVRAHHERPDGTGYPRGLSGEDIPLESRIIAVADAYDAMTSDRPHSPAVGSLRARRELRSLAGKQFDAGVVEAFIAALSGPSRDHRPSQNQEQVAPQPQVAPARSTTSPEPGPPGAYRQAEEVSVTSGSSAGA